MSGRRALLIAASEYRDPGLRRLRSPVHDITELGRLLGAAEIGGFEVEALVDRPDAEVRGRLGRFLRTARRSDTLLIHFACHGFTDVDGQLYLTAPDTVVADISVTALSAALLTQLIDRSPSRRVILIIDCCFSGAISRVMTHRGGDEIPVGEFFRGEGEGRAVITASKAEEYAWELDDDPRAVRRNPLHSVFAEALIEGLRTGDADLDGDGEVSVDDLYEYVYRRVVAAGSAQTPSRWNYVQGRIFVAHRARGPARAAAVEPASGSLPVRTPWDAELLEWRYPVTGELESFLHSLALTPRERQAWRILRNGEHEAAGTAFDGILGEATCDDTAWLGRAFCAAAAADWDLAGALFERAAARLSRAASGVAASGGSALLAGVCYTAVDRSRADEVIDEASASMPYAPELMAYRAVRRDLPATLSAAFRLDPRLAGEFEAVGFDTRAVVHEANRTADGLLALLFRARAEVDAVSGRPDGPVVTSVPGPPSAERLLRCRDLTITQRGRLTAELPGLSERAARLLGGPGTRAVVAEAGAVRDAALSALAALRRTDQPAPMRLIGIPARSKR